MTNTDQQEAGERHGNFLTSAAATPRHPHPPPKGVRDGYRVERTVLPESTRIHTNYKDHIRPHQELATRTSNLRSPPHNLTHDLKAYTIPLFLGLGIYITMKLDTFTHAYGMSLHFSKGPHTAHLITLVPNTIPGKYSCWNQNP